MSSRKGSVKGTSASKYSREKLLSTMQSKMSQLQNAIANISLTKKRLRHNAQEVKSEIHSSVGRQLEVLRTREVHLLNQVEVIETAKDQLLSHQQDALHQALGGLHSLAVAGEDAGACGGPDNPSVLVHISDSLEGLNALELAPEEQADMAFDADMLSLRESIRTFGQVVTDAGSPTLDPFSIPHEGSTSLPKPFEEYEDEEQQVLYKSLQTNSSNVQVTIPNMSLNPHDWLFLPTHVPEPAPLSDEPRFVFPPFQPSEMSQWLASSGAADSLSSSASLHLWLQDLQHQSQMEEEDTGGFEILARSPLTPVSADLPQPSSNPTQAEAGFAYFDEVAAAPITTWLLTPGAAMAGVDLQPDYPFIAMAYFRDISNDTKYWLMDYQAAQEIELGTSGCAGSCVKAGSPVGGNVDIENLGDRFLCIQPAPENRSHSLLYPAAGETKDEDRDVDEQEVTMQLCKANEPCRTFNECVSDDNCCMQSDLEECEGNLWLATNMPSVHEACVEFPHFKDVESQSNSEWLRCGSLVESDEETMSVLFHPFENDDKTLNDWLIESKDVLTMPCTQATVLDLTQWLQPAIEDESGYSCPQFQNLGGIAKSDSRSWLSKMSVKDSSEKETEVMKTVEVKEGLSKWLHYSVECKEERVSGRMTSMRLKESAAHWLLQSTCHEKAEELPELMEGHLSKLDNMSNNEIFECFKESTNALNMSHWLVGGAH